MNLRLIREPTAQQTTLGVLFVDGRFRAFSLEDAIREEPGVDVRRWKIPGETAIPAGRYRVDWTYSMRFHRNMIQVLDVPGFEGIRIHKGNDRTDTEGCIILGIRRAGVHLEQSAPAVDELEGDVKAAKALDRPIWLLIENPLV